MAVGVGVEVGVGDGRGRVAVTVGVGVQVGVGDGGGVAVTSGGIIVGVGVSMGAGGPDVGVAEGVVAPRTSASRKAPLVSVSTAGKRLPTATRVAGTGGTGAWFRSTQVCCPDETITDWPAAITVTIPSVTTIQMV